MSIIITDSFKYCPELPGRTLVNFKSIKKIENDLNVIAAVCTRGMANHILKHNFPNLKFIQLFSAGYDGIDLNIVKNKGITLCNAANIYNIGMSEFVVYAMLMRAKRYHKSIKNHRIRPLRNYQYITELCGKTAGIMGCGNIGNEIAKRLSAFDMKVIGYDSIIDRKTNFENIFGLTEISEFVSKCDYLINCLPLMPSTTNLLNNKLFRLMKDNVTFVNVGRKQIINDKDFIKFLKTHPDATAILDMFEMVPNPITNPYRRLNNVLVLPGVTAISQEISERLKVLILDNVNRMREGLTLQCVISNPV